MGASRNVKERGRLGWIGDTCSLKYGPTAWTQTFKQLSHLSF